MADITFVFVFIAGAMHKLEVRVFPSRPIEEELPIREIEAQFELALKFVLVIVVSAQEALFVPLVPVLRRFGIGPVV